MGSASIVGKQREPCRDVQEPDTEEGPTRMHTFDTTLPGTVSAEATRAASAEQA